MCVLTGFIAFFRYKVIESAGTRLPLEDSSEGMPVLQRFFECPVLKSTIAAAQLSWKTGYRGVACQGLARYIQHVLEKSQGDHKQYARYFSITQFSGMGKSRMVDELGKTYFVIPMCMRASATGSFFFFFLNVTSRVITSFTRVSTS